MDGAIVKGEETEARDGIVELETVTVAGPGKAVSVAEIAAVSCVALTKVVWRGEPFQFTTNPLGTKFVPFIVKVMPAGLQAGVVFDDVVDPDSDVMVGRTIGNEIAFDVFALAAGLATATWHRFNRGKIRSRDRRAELSRTDIAGGQLRQVVAAVHPLHAGAGEKIASGNDQRKAGCSSRRAHRRNGCDHRHRERRGAKS